MSKEVTFEALSHTLQAVITRCQHSIEKFKKNLDENPAYAFEWGTDALASAATLRVVEEAKHYLDTPHKTGEGEDEVLPFEQKLAQLREYFTRSMMSACEQVPSSTSTMSNMVDNYRRQALVKLVNTLNGEYFSGF